MPSGRWCVQTNVYLAKLNDVLSLRTLNVTQPSFWTKTKVQSFSFDVTAVP